MERFLLVGQAPSRVAGSAAAFDALCGRFLAALAGSTWDAFLLRVEPVNLLAAWPGKCGKGDRFPPAEARSAAQALGVRGRRVLLAGLGVARAFGLRRPRFLAPCLLGRGEAAAWVVPHPSAVSHWWNLPANAAAASAFLRGLLAGGPPVAQDAFGGARACAGGGKGV